MYGSGSALRQPPTVSRLQSLIGNPLPADVNNKYDVASALSSVSHPSLDHTVRQMCFDSQDEKFVRDRYRRSFSVVKVHGDTAVVRNGSGCLPGDGGAPQMFGETFNRHIGDWDSKMTKFVDTAKKPPINAEHFHSDTLCRLATTR